MAHDGDCGEVDFESTDRRRGDPRTSSAEDAGKTGWQRTLPTAPPEADSIAAAVRLGGLERAIEVVLVPPVALWELGRFVLVRVLPGLIRRVGAALAWLIRLPVTSVRWLGDVAADLFREVEQLIAPPIRALVRIFRPVGSALGAVGRRAVVIARTIARPVAEVLRVCARTVRAVGSRFLVLLRSVARVVGRLLAAFGRRIAVVVRAAARIAARTLARPVRAAAKVVRAAGLAVLAPLRWAWARVVAAALTGQRGIVWLIEHLVLMPVRAAKRALRFLVRYLVEAPAGWAWARVLVASRAARRVIVWLGERLLLVVRRILGPPVAALLAIFRQLQAKLAAAARAAAAACVRVAQPVVLASGFAGRAVRQAAARAHAVLLASRLRVTVSIRLVRERLRAFVFAVFRA